MARPINNGCVHIINKKCSGYNIPVTVGAIVSDEIDSAENV